MKQLLLSLSAALLLSSPALAANQNIVLGTANTITFRGPVDGSSITRAQLKLVELVKARGSKKYPLYLVLDSPGGSIIAGLAFEDFAKTIPNLHTITIFSASMAAGFVEALPGRRYILDTGILMFHRAKGGFEGQFEEGEVESQLKLWKEIVLKMENDSASRIGIPLSEYKAKVINEWWLFGASAVVQKAADEVVSITCTQDLIDEREIITQRMFIFVSTSEYSGCPLFRAPLPSKSKPEEEEEE